MRPYPNYYELLGVGVNAHPAQIEAAYQTIIEIVNNDLTLESRIELDVARKTLLIPEERYRYNMELIAEIEQELAIAKKNEPVVQLKQTSVYKHPEVVYLPAPTQYSTQHPVNIPQNGAVSFLGGLSAAYGFTMLTLIVVGLVVNVIY